MTDDSLQSREAALLRAIQRDLPLLSTLLEEMSGHWQYCYRPRCLMDQVGFACELRDGEAALAFQLPIA